MQVLREECTIFWNCIYYFNEHGLPFDFILPYEDVSIKENFDKYKLIQEKKIQILQPDEKNKVRKDAAARKTAGKGKDDARLQDTTKR